MSVDPLVVVNSTIILNDGAGRSESTYVCQKSLIYKPVYLESIGLSNFHGTCLNLSKIKFDYSTPSPQQFLRIEKMRVFKF